MCASWIYPGTFWLICLHDTSLAHSQTGGKVVQPNQLIHLVVQSHSAIFSLQTVFKGKQLCRFPTNYLGHLWLFLVYEIHSARIGHICANLSSGVYSPDVYCSHVSFLGFLICGEAPPVQKWCLCALCPVVGWEWPLRRSSTRWVTDWVRPKYEIHRPATLGSSSLGILS